eukprot:1040882-Prymnesium_polylepis.1
MKLRKSRRQVPTMQLNQHPMEVISQRGDMVLLVAVGARLLSALLASPWVLELSEGDTAGIGRALYQSYQTGISLDVVLVMMRLLNHCSVSKDFGILVIMLNNMASDLGQFFKLMLIVMLVSAHLKKSRLSHRLLATCLSPKWKTEVLRSVPSLQAFFLSFIGMSHNTTLEEDELSPDLADGLASHLRQLRARPGADDTTGIGLPLASDVTTNSSVASRPRQR